VSADRLPGLIVLRWQRRGQLLALGRIARARLRATRVAAALVGAALAPLVIVVALVSRRAARAIARAALWPLIEEWEAVTPDGAVVATVEVLPFLRWQALPSTRASISARATRRRRSSTASA
jgi:hypothetical protein